jgi:hypothetical protein
LEADRGNSMPPLSAAFESLVRGGVLMLEATMTQLVDPLAWEPDRLQQLRRPLFLVDQGLRLGAGACNLGRELVASIQGRR